jgi:hypothetical protein
MIRDTRTAYRARAAATERSIDAAMAQVKAAAAELAADYIAARARRAAPVPFTEADLAAARAVRTMYGWQCVIRVNAKTVTVLGDFGDYRIPKKTILEVKK